MAEGTTTTSPLKFATELTIAWLANSNTKAAAEDVPAFLQTIHATVAVLAGGPNVIPPEEDQKPTHQPAVTVRKSLASKDHIISLIDGKPYKTLRRHLGLHGLTPDQYRQRYGLKADYPMVSESYSLVRREMAKQIGLGRKPGQSVAKTKAADTSRRAASRRKKRHGMLVNSSNTVSCNP